MSSEPDSFDAIVIGAGPAGEVAAGRLADGGLRVAIIERELIGGECSFYACMPSKALIRPGALLGEARRTPGVAEALTGELDATAALARRDEVIHDRDDSGMIPWLDEHQITLIRGEARLEGPRRVRVGNQVLSASRAVVIATGSEAALPPIDGLPHARPWTNREATTAKAVPASIVLIGGGPVGCELAQAWRRLGSQVVLIEAGGLLAREEPFAAEQIGAALAADGIVIRTDARIVHARRVEGEGFAVELGTGETLRGEQLVVAAGRRPRTAGLGLESAELGVMIEPGQPLGVDDHLRVDGSEWLYAIGDVNGRAPLTHAGKYQARACADAILGRGDDRRAWADLAGTPRVTFTDPQVAATGLTLAQAGERGIRARAVDVATQANAGASFHGRDTEGTSCLVVDEDRGVIIGATFVGYESAELLHAATIAITAEVPLERLWHAIPAFPTRNEVWLKLLESYGL